MVRSKLLAAAVAFALATTHFHYAYSEEAPKGPLAPEKADIAVAPVDVKILTLEQCIALAFEKNPGLQIEQEKIIELENDYSIASAGLYPKLSASAYYTKANPDRVGIQPLMRYSEESLGQIKLKQLLYDGGKTRYSGRAASKAADAQRDSAEATRLDTVYIVSQAYYRVLEARELLQVGENSRSQREAFFKLTDSYQKAGKATRIESLKAEAQLLDAERSLVQAQEALRISELILKKNHRRWRRFEDQHCRWLAGDIRGTGNR